jgi:hypothetical protein
MATLQELADEAFADPLKKHGIPIDLKGALRKSARLQDVAKPNPGKPNLGKPNLGKPSPAKPNPVKQSPGALRKGARKRGRKT